jgi:rod shape-determining protein MreC
VRERSGSVSRLALPIRAAAQRVALPFLIFLSVMLVVLGKADIVLFDRARTSVSDALAPILDAVAQPLGTVAAGVRKAEDLFAVYGENQRLREENQRLLQWQEVARRLETENAELKGLLHFEPQDVHGYITARVIANSGGAFLRNVLVDVGAHEGVERGQAAIAGEGIVGRVAEVGARAARVLLVTDLNSRIPVVLETSRERAVLAGDNTPRPRLLYLAGKATVKVGDRIVTSGSGGIFPPGLPVGVVASVDNGLVHVEPYAELSHLEYVRIVDFGLSGVLPQSAIPMPKAPKGSRRAPDAETP